MPQPGAAPAKPILSPAPESRPFLLRTPGDPAEPVERSPAPPTRTYRVDPFEVRLSGKLLRAQMRGSLPARLR